MKAMIFAAGLGTRLKPLTDHMPKALVPVAGRPMLEHVILKLKKAGFTELVINIHHFGEQIIDFLKANQNFGLTIHISDERDKLLDTGGGIKKAATFFTGTEPFLVHNVDILSNADLKEVYDFHRKSQNQATLLVSPRKTSRYLLFDTDNRLPGLDSQGHPANQAGRICVRTRPIPRICIQRHPCNFTGSVSLHGGRDMER